MGFFKWLLGNDDSRSALLLKQVLDGQAERLKYDTEIEKLKREIEYKTRQLELENIELVSEEKRKDRQQAVQLRQWRQEQAARARAAKVEKAKLKGATPNGTLHQTRVTGCVVCGDPSSPNLTADEIKWHHAGHPGAMQ